MCVVPGHVIITKVNGSPTITTLCCDLPLLLENLCADWNTGVKKLTKENPRLRATGVVQGAMYLLEPLVKCIT